MLPSIIYGLNILQVCGLGILALRLWRSGLSATYRYLTLRSAFECARVFATFFIEKRSEAYALTYLATQPVLWTLDALVLLEVYTRVFNTHKGIASFSRKVIPAAMIISVVTAGASFAFKPAVASEFAILDMSASLERGVNISLLCFIILLVGFLAWFPVPISRNTFVHSTVFCFYFASRAGAFLFRMTVPQDAWPILSLALVSASLISVLVWVFGLRPAGEAVTLRSGLHRTSVDQARLIEQLEAINRSLMRTARE